MEHFWTALNVMVTLKWFFIVLSQTLTQTNLRKVKMFAAHFMSLINKESSDEKVAYVRKYI